MNWFSVEGTLGCSNSTSANGFFYFCLASVFGAYLLAGFTTFFVESAFLICTGSGNFGTGAYKLITLPSKTSNWGSGSNLQSIISIDRNGMIECLRHDVIVSLIAIYLRLIASSPFYFAIFSSWSASSFEILTFWSTIFLTFLPSDSSVKYFYFVTIGKYSVISNVPLLSINGLGFCCT